MKIPERLNILGFDYQIIHSPEGDKCLQCMDHWAQHSPKERAIRIESGTEGQNRTSLFLHEVLEAMNLILRLNLDHDGQLCKLEAGLFQVLTTNKLNFGDDT